jgi:hypothetical protein
VKFARISLVVSVSILIGGKSQLLEVMGALQPRRTATQTGSHTRRAHRTTAGARTAPL